MKRCQRAPLECGWLGKEDSSSLAAGRGARQQVLDLVEWKAAIFQLGWTAFRDAIHRCADVTEWGKALIISPDVCELSTSGDNIGVSQLFTLPAAPPRRQDNYLAVAHGLWFGQAKDSAVLKL